MGSPTRVTRVRRNLRLVKLGNSRKRKIRVEGTTAAHLPLNVPNTQHASQPQGLQQGREIIIDAPLSLHLQTVMMRHLYLMLASFFPSYRGQGSPDELPALYDVQRPLPL